MGDPKSGGADERAARLAARLRDNLRRRKAQARGRDDLSGLDPNRKDTPLNRPDPGSDDGANAGRDAVGDDKAVGIGAAADDAAGGSGRADG